MGTMRLGRRCAVGVRFSRILFLSKARLPGHGSRIGNREHSEELRWFKDLEPFAPLVTGFGAVLERRALCTNLAAKQEFDSLGKTGGDGGCPNLIQASSAKSSRGHAETESDDRCGSRPTSRNLLRRAVVKRRLSRQQRPSGAGRTWNDRYRQ